VYDSVKGAIWHADLYRLRRPEEIPDLGLVEACFDSICLIEWPSLLLPFIEEANLTWVDL
jgi:tRNA A37 threonylcarbamoyladenosine biosynthesis protein TsaE